MNRILCSTGALITRRNGRNHNLLRELSERLECDGYEFMIYDSWYDNIESITEDVREMELNIPVVHCEKKIGELIAMEDESAFELFEINCGAAKKLCSEKLVLHLWNGMVSDSNFQANLSAYSRLAEISEKLGLMLTVENVVCNCGSPMEHFLELSERYPHISFTFDTKMAEFHGELSEVYNEELWKNHIRHLHINDLGGGIKDWTNLKTLHIGDGHVDFDSFFGFAKKMQYSGDFTVEATAVRPDGSVDIDKLNEDFMKIKGYIA